MGVVVVGPSEEEVAARGGIHLELVKYAFVLVQVAQLLFDIISDLDRFHVFRIVSNIPKFEAQVIPCAEVILFFRQKRS